MNQLKKISMIGFIFSTALFLSGTPAIAQYSQEQNEINDSQERSTGQQSQSSTSQSSTTSTKFGPTHITSDRYVKKMLDMDVVNNQDEDIGTIEDFALDNNNKIEYAIISVGGFLGIGDKLVSVRMDRLRVNQNEEKIMLDATKQELEQANEFQYKR